MLLTEKIASSQFQALIGTNPSTGALGYPNYNRIETAIFGIAINAIEHAIKEKRDSPASMLTEGIKLNFRYCTIDLDSGYFLYADHP